MHPDCKNDLTARIQSALSNVYRCVEQCGSPVSAVAIRKEADMLSRILAVSVVAGLAGFALSGCVSEDGYYSGGYYTYGGGYGPGPYVYDDYYAPAGGVYYGGYYRSSRYRHDRHDHRRGRYDDRNDRDHRHGDRDRPGRVDSSDRPSGHAPKQRYRLVEHPRGDQRPMAVRSGANQGKTPQAYRLEKKSDQDQ
jgi:hypothetical protein